MKVVNLALAVALLGAFGPAYAQPSSDESAFALDLDAANLHSYFIKCKSGKDITNCPGPSIWENTNGLKGLQTGSTPGDAGPVAKDMLLLG
jgi:hypothetical protein